MTDSIKVIHDLIQAATGLEGSLIRPRWQPVPPKQPPVEVNWCAFGEVSSGFDAAQILAGEDQATLHRQDRMEILVSFYGPDAGGKADLLRAALHIPATRAPLRRAGLAIIAVGASTTAPELIHDRWLRRVDLSLTLRHAHDRTVGIPAIHDPNITFVKDTRHVSVG